MLDNLFSFLRRKSDFYTGADQKKIEGIVLDHVRKHAALAEKQAAEKRIAAEKEAKQKKERLEKQKREEEAKRAAELAAVKQAAAAAGAPEDDVLELNDDGTFDTSAMPSVAPSAPAKAVAAVVKPPAAPVEKSKDDGDKSDAEDDKTPARTYLNILLFMYIFALIIIRILYLYISDW